MPVFPFLLLSTEERHRQLCAQGPEGTISEEVLPAAADTDVSLTLLPAATDTALLPAEAIIDTRTDVATTTDDAIETERDTDPVAVTIDTAIARKEVIMTAVAAATETITIREIAATKLKASHTHGVGHRCCACVMALA